MFDVRLISLTLVRQWELTCIDSHVPLKTLVNFKNQHVFVSKFIEICSTIQIILCVKLFGVE